MWSPLEDGLSVSGLNLWLQDHVAFELYYLQRMEAVEAWNKNIAFGTLVQAGIEGYINSAYNTKGLSRFIQQEYLKQSEKYALSEEIARWARLAVHLTNNFVDHYQDDINLISSSEVHYKQVCILPSKREITLHGHLDGVGDKLIFENKVRGRWSEEKIAENIQWDLQYNYYCLLFFLTHGHTPETVWYQHIRRPGDFGFRGPKKRKTEDSDDYQTRLFEHITNNRDYYFYRFQGAPSRTKLEQFCFASLYPILEAFLNWYEFVTTESADYNCHHWMTPYGLYNPFVEGTEEKFRNYRLTGSHIGLKSRDA